MATVDQLQREVGEIRRAIDELTIETRANTGTLAGAIRTTRRQVDAAELMTAVKRIRPSSATQLWDPRVGRFIEPPLESSLGDRLRAGAASGSGAAVTPWATQAYNLLADPTMEGGGETAYAVTAEVAIARGMVQDAFGITSGTTIDAWFASRSAGTGTVNVVPSWKKRGMGQTTFNSSSFGVQITGADATWALRSADSITEASAGAYDLPTFAQPYMTAAIVVRRMFAASAEGVATGKLVTLEIYDSTDAVVRATQTFNVASLADFETFRMSCYFAPTSAQKTHDYQLRFRYAVTGWASGVVNLVTGDPMLAYAYTQDTPSYSPALGKWAPRSVYNYGQYDGVPIVVGRGLADASARLVIARDSIEWGGGTASRDARVAYTGPSELTWDDANDLPLTTKHVGPLFIEGPTSMDLAITYAGPGKPDTVTRTDAALISTSVITYTGAKVASVVTTRFGKTITVTPTYTGDDITSVHRAVA